MTKHLRDVRSEEKTYRLEDRVGQNRSASQEGEVGSILFARSEPILSENILDLARTFVTLDIGTHSLTNGFLFDEPLSAGMVRTGPSTLWFSIDGPNEAVHDRVRSVPGPFLKVVGGIERLVWKGSELGNTTPRLIFYCTISSDDVDKIHRMPSSIRTHGMTSLR